MAAYASWDPNNGTENAVFAAARALLSLPAVTEYLNGPDDFGPGGSDADLVRCAVLQDATPWGLAAYAGRGQREEAVVGKLLNDTLLMRDMLVAGGASISDLRI